MTISARNLPFIILFLAVAFGLGAWQASGQELARSGKARAVIVVAKGAPAPVQHAALELAFFLHKVTGASFLVVGTDTLFKRRLLVGPEAARLVLPHLPMERLAADEIVIRSHDQDLVLTGGHPRGTLYAVYTFLEDSVGCHWWTPKASTIPKRPALVIPKLNIRYRPPFAYRETYWKDALDGDWAVRNRLNGHFSRLDETRGGKITYQGFVHTFYRILPPKIYFAAHPEWYSLVNGRRTCQRAQLCLTNEAMRKEFVLNLAKQLRAHPNVRIASVSQNDNFGPCSCDACRAVDKQEGSRSGTLLRFVNAVAADIEQEFPKVSISTLAYQYTRHPPRLVRPRAHVIVRLCSIECSFLRPLTARRNRDFAQDVLGWSRIAKRLYVWDYVTNFRHYLMPHPNLRVLAPNVKFFAKHGVTGLFEQGAGNASATEMAPLRAWVLAKLMWDPTRDGEALIEQFLKGYYGAAAWSLNAYLTELHAVAENTGDHVGFYSPADKAHYLSLRFLTRALKDLDDAEKAVSGNTTLELRVRVARLPILYAFLVRWKILRQQMLNQGLAWPVADNIRVVQARFLAVAKEAGLTRVGESYGLDRLQSVVDAVARGK